jgi:integrase
VQRNDYRAVQLVGKGRKQRMVPLWKESAHHIRAWLKLAGLKPDQPLLPNRFGGPMTRTGVQQRLQLHIQRAQANCPSLRLRRIGHLAPARSSNAQNCRPRLMFFRRISSIFNNCEISAACESAAAYNFKNKLT